MIPAVKKVPGTKRCQAGATVPVQRGTRKRYRKGSLIGTLRYLVLGTAVGAGNESKSLVPRFSVKPPGGWGVRTRGAPMICDTPACGDYPGFRIASGSLAPDPERAKECREQAETWTRWQAAHAAWLRAPRGTPQPPLPPGHEPFGAPATRSATIKHGQGGQ